VRQVDVATNVITTSAGASGPRDFDLLALQASLSGVGQVVIDGAGNVFHVGKLLHYLALRLCVPFPF